MAAWEPAGLRRTRRGQWRTWRAQRDQGSAAWWEVGRRACDE